MGRHTWQRACSEINHRKFKTNSRFKQFKVDKAHNIKQSSQSSKFTQGSKFTFLKWNTLTLEGAEVKYLPMTPEGAGVNPYMSLYTSLLLRSPVPLSYAKSSPSQKHRWCCSGRELRHKKGGGMSELNTQPCPRRSLLSWIANLPLR